MLNFWSSNYVYVSYQKLKIFCFNVWLLLYTRCKIFWYIFSSYGYTFLQEAYLYHLYRSDTRHNFSVYFYTMYLTAGSWYGPILSAMMFIPQIILLVGVSLKFFLDLPYCFFLHTFIFVTFNKVYTSQVSYIFLINSLPIGLKKVALISYPYV